MADSRLKILLGCVLLSLYLLVYTGKVASDDGLALLAVATSTVRHGAPEIGVMGANDALQPFDVSRMGTWGLDGALYSKKGLTPSVGLIPLVVLAELLPWLDTRATAMLFNPLVTVATALALYTLVRRLNCRPRTAFVTTLIFGAATMAIVYTKSLFGEPLAALLMTLVVLAALQYRETAKPHPSSLSPLPGAGETYHRERHCIANLSIAGSCLGLLLGVNLAYALVVAIIGLYLFWPLSNWPGAKRLSAFVAPILVALVVIGLHNEARFGSPFDSGYHFESGEGFTSSLLVGLYGLFLGPYRGLFWYNPVLLLAIPGWLMLRRILARLAWLVLTLVALQALSFASWWSWHGGIVWGPRFLVPVLPLVALCLAPLVEAVWERPVLKLIVATFAVLSLGVQALGALYSFYPYIGLLYARYYDPAASKLADEVLYNPGLSAIVGHLALALARWPVEVAWLANGVDVVHLLAALGLAGVGIVATLREQRWERARRILPVVAAIVALVIIAARQQRGEEHQNVCDLQAALQPSGTVLVASTLFGESLIDLESRDAVLSTNAPTQSGDLLASAMWDYALRQSSKLWLVTWFTPAHPDNWQERELWQTAAFAQERPAAGHRALLFDLTPTEPQQAGGWRFGNIQLDRYSVQAADDGVRVALAWSADTGVDADYNWFVHLLATDGTIIAQQDRQPQGGYAPTSAWRPGDTIIDRLYFPLAPGTDTERWALRVGWVAPETGERLPAFDPARTALTDSYAILDVVPERTAR